MQRQFQFRPSRYLAAILSIAHGAALVALFPLDLPVWTKAGLAFLVLLSLGYHLWRDAWLSASSAIVSLVLDGDMIMLVSRGGEQLAGRMLRDTLVTPFLAVLNVMPEGARFSRSMVILPDSLDAESFRQLRVWLKWGVDQRSGRTTSSPDQP
jgi:toxin CptA